MTVSFDQNGPNFMRVRKWVESRVKNNKITFTDGDLLSLKMQSKNLTVKPNRTVFSKRSKSLEYAKKASEDTIRRAVRQCLIYMNLRFSGLSRNQLIQLASQLHDKNIDRLKDYLNRHGVAQHDAIPPKLYTSRLMYTSIWFSQHSEVYYNYMIDHNLIKVPVVEPFTPQEDNPDDIDQDDNFTLD